MSIWDSDLPGLPESGAVTGETSVGPVPRVALTREEAAAAIGMSLNSFERHVQPTMRLVRLGRMRLVPVSELQRWLTEHARPTLDDDPKGAPATGRTARGHGPEE